MVLSLHQNMRLDALEPENVAFAKYLTEIGDDPKEDVDLPPSVTRCKDMDGLINSLYPWLETKERVSSERFTERVILSAPNEDVHKINAAAMNALDGDMYTYLAADKLNADDAGNTQRLNSEFLQNLNPPGMPRFKLEIKVGCPIMVLRNLAPSEGLCNGTRLLVTRCGQHVIEAKILTGDKAGEIVFIPRINFKPTATEMNINLTRHQFPICPAYAMTINKSQGQSVKYVGIDLRTPVFSHGQLYVALSRCTAARRINVR
ncbi:ATP-dependent DNA helicase PIF7-like [Papaver somniferum]|uniref:ATP-dependent DNA helicase PIF7-like n=1 Tax=Papaver somniferum TaxID=3469 RepID=UPI000E702033|nr:ATP-dependent DNA helicase PIF7-like [Papaver somniferum]